MYICNPREAKARSQCWGQLVRSCLYLFFFLKKAYFRKNQLKLSKVIWLGHNSTPVLIQKRKKRGHAMWIQENSHPQAKERVLKGTNATITLNLRTSNLQFMREYAFVTLWHSLFSMFLGQPQKTNKFSLISQSLLWRTNQRGCVLIHCSYTVFGIWCILRK